VAMAAAGGKLQTDLAAANLAWPNRGTQYQFLTAEA